MAYKERSATHRYSYIATVELFLSFVTLLIFMKFMPGLESKRPPIEHVSSPEGKDRTFTAEQRERRRRELVHELKGQAWDVYMGDDVRRDVPANFKRYEVQVHGEPGLLLLDPDIIELDSLEIDEETGEIDEIDLGMAEHENAEIFDSIWVEKVFGEDEDLEGYMKTQPGFASLRARLEAFRSELDLPEGVELKGDSIHIGSLEIRAGSLRWDQAEELLSKYQTTLQMNDITVHSSVMISIYREEGQDKPQSDAQRLVGRNPDIAKHDLRSSLRIAGEQLLRLGYEHAMCSPTDKRRARVYGLMNMQPFHTDSDGVLYMGAPLSVMMQGRRRPATRSIH